MKTQTYKIIELPEMVGKSLKEVKKYLEKTYPEQLASEEHKESFIKSNPTLPNWTWCFFFGSLVRSEDGYWNVPCAIWFGSKWHRYAYWLVSAWYSDCRVVLLEIETGDLNYESGLAFDSLKFDIRLKEVEKTLALIKKALI